MSASPASVEVTAEQMRVDRATKAKADAKARLAAAQANVNLYQQIQAELSEQGTALPASHEQRLQALQLEVETCTALVESVKAEYVESQNVLASCIHAARAPPPAPPAALDPLMLAQLLQLKSHDSDRYRPKLPTFDGEKVDENFDAFVAKLTSFIAYCKFTQESAAVNCALDALSGAASAYVQGKTFPDVQSLLDTLRIRFVPVLRDELLMREALRGCTTPEQVFLTLGKLPAGDSLPLKWLKSLVLLCTPTSQQGDLRLALAMVKDAAELERVVLTRNGTRNGNRQTLGGDDPMVGQIGGRPPIRGGGRAPFRAGQLTRGGFRGGPSFRPPPARHPAGHPPMPRGACYRCGQFHWAVGPNRTPCPSPPLAGSAVGSLESDTWRNLPSTQGGASSPPTGGGHQ